VEAECLVPIVPNIIQEKIDCNSMAHNFDDPDLDANYGEFLKTPVTEPISEGRVVGNIADPIIEGRVVGNIAYPIIEGKVVGNIAEEPQLYNSVVEGRISNMTYDGILEGTVVDTELEKMLNEIPEAPKTEIKYYTPAERSQRCKIISDFTILMKHKSFTTFKTICIESFSQIYFEKFTNLELYNLINLIKQINLNPTDQSVCTALLTINGIITNKMVKKGGKSKRKNRKSKRKKRLTKRYKK